MTLQPAPSQVAPVARLTPVSRLALLGIVLLPVLGAVAIDLPLCPAAALFGLPCPGCGLTRASLAVLHGDFLAALHFHPLVFVLAPVYLLLVGAALVGFVRGPAPQLAREPRTEPKRPLSTHVAVTWIGATLLVLLLGVWGARFLGLFGGPVPVETLSEWIARQQAAP